MTGQSLNQIRDLYGINHINTLMGFICRFNVLFLYKYYTIHILIFKFYMIKILKTYYEN